MDYEARHRELMLPCVRVRTGAGGGSGTVIYSRENSPEVFSTYILTNFHVISNLIEIKKEWSHLLNREIKTDVLSPAEVHFFEYQWSSRTEGANAKEAEIVAYDANEDLALLRLKSEKPVASVAKMLAKGTEKDLRVTQEVFIVGAGMNEPPVITGGMISQFGANADNREFWMSTAPIIFGNSGGALFLAETHELIGVPAKLAMIDTPSTQIPVTHYSFAIPITRVYEFLDDQRFNFVYDDNHTEEADAEQRRQLRENDEYRIAQEEQRDGGQSGSKSEAPKAGGLEV